MHSKEQGSGHASGGLGSLQKVWVKRSKSAPRETTSCQSAHNRARLVRTIKVRFSMTCNISHRAGFPGSHCGFWGRNPMEGPSCPQPKCSSHGASGACGRASDRAPIGFGKLRHRQCAVGNIIGFHLIIGWKPERATDIYSCHHLIPGS